MFKLGWNSVAIERYLCRWAPSTRSQYNSHLVKFKEYCDTNSINFPHVADSDIAVYLTYLASTTSRPKSLVYGTLAALTAFYDALDYNPISSDIRRLAEGIVKGGTLSPMIKSSVFPVKPFMSLFQAWPPNDIILLKFLRMKAICLLALTFMLRPSDIAPRSVVMDPQTGAKHRVIFSVDHITFPDQGGMQVVFHGIKNDYDRDGFTVKIPESPDIDPKIDPVQCMKSYIQRTDHIRHQISGKPVFLTLNAPFSAIDSRTVSKVLSECISMAGLAGKGFTAKSFRPTGATCAIDGGVNPDTARYIGRWRCADTFFKHYVHTKVPNQYVSDLLHHR